ncbi:MAG: hypothetical protein IT463_02310, partial [Planctomycetes bacterium]|nr:hypothetical protein [Planctomycetota bacterium]
MSATTEQPGLHPAEREARRAYGGEYYNAHTVSMGAGAQLDYFERQLAERLAVLRKISHGKILLDLCCGPGMHLN